MLACDHQFFPSAVFPRHKHLLLSKRKSIPPNQQAGNTTKVLLMSANISFTWLKLELDYANPGCRSANHAKDGWKVLPGSLCPQAILRFIVAALLTLHASKLAPAGTTILV